MAQNVNPTFVKTPQTAAVQITTGTGSSALVTVYTGGANGSKIAGLLATAFGTTAAFDVQWGITSSAAVFYLLGTVSVSCGAGSSNGIPSINMLGNANLPGITIDSDNNPFVLLASSGWSLQAKSPATSSQWATGAVINLSAPAIGDF